MFDEHRTSITSGATYPRATEDVPLIDAEVFAQLLNILDEVPRRVLLERRGPTTKVNKSPTARTTADTAEDTTHGVDLPEPR